MKTTKISVYKNPARRALEFYLWVRDGEKLWAAEPIVLKEHDDSALSTRVDPTFLIDEETGQSLIDQLWSEGFRPKEMDAPGALQAQGRHLEDMRKLVFSYSEMLLNSLYEKE